MSNKSHFYFQCTLETIKMPPKRVYTPEERKRRAIKQKEYRERMKDNEEYKEKARKRKRVSIYILLTLRRNVFKYFAFTFFTSN